jgi:hypothetical protein
MAEIRSLVSRWDRQSCVLWFAVTFDNGTTTSVGVPLSHVVATIDAAMASVGVTFAPTLGDIESVDGLFSSIKKAVKSVGKVASKAVKTATRTIDAGVRTTAKIVNSRALNLGMSGLKLVPVVGALASQAHDAAKLAVNQYDNAKRLAAMGLRTPQALRQIASGANVARSIRVLAANPNPQARLAVAALQSVR